MVLTRRRSMLLSAPTLPTPSVATPSPSSSSRSSTAVETAHPLATTDASLLPTAPIASDSTLYTDGTAMDDASQTSALGLDFPIVLQSSAGPPAPTVSDEANHELSGSRGLYPRRPSLRTGVGHSAPVIPMYRLPSGTSSSAVADSTKTSTATSPARPSPLASPIAFDAIHPLAGHFPSLSILPPSALQGYSSTMPPRAPSSSGASVVFSRQLAKDPNAAKRAESSRKKTRAASFTSPLPSPTPSLPSPATPVSPLSIVDSPTQSIPRLRQPPASTRRDRKKPPGHTPRPPNAWILYRSAQIQLLKQDEELARKPQSDISKLIGYMWRDESPEIRKYYEEQAAIKKAEHALMYPNYTFAPVRKAKSEVSSPAVSSATNELLASLGLDSDFNPIRPKITRRDTEPTPRVTSRTRARASTAVQASVSAPSQLDLSLLFGSPFSLSTSMPSTGSQNLFPPAVTPQVTLDTNMDNFIASLEREPLSPDLSLDGLNFSPHYETRPELQKWSSYHPDPSSYFNQSSSLPLDDLALAPPLSAPAAVASFSFGDPGPIFDSLHDTKNFYTGNSALDHSPFDYTSYSSSTSASSAPSISAYSPPPIHINNSDSSFSHHPHPQPSITNDSLSFEASPMSEDWDDFRARAPTPDEPTSPPKDDAEHSMESYTFPSHS